MKASTGKRASGEALLMNRYELELARGVSHVASTMYGESMLAAIRETIQAFEASYGRDDLKVFAHALLKRLKLRGKTLAANVLDDFIQSGRLPEKIADAPSGLVSARKSTPRKRKGRALQTVNAHASS